MRSLSVHFVTAGDVTNVLLLPIGASIGHYAIWTCTSYATYSRLYILVTAHIDVDVDRRLTHGWLECDGWRHADRGRRRGFGVT